MQENLRPITKQGFENLKSELERLMREERPKIIQAIAEARGHGDISENAEYDAAKDSQALLEKRIAEMKANLANAEIIDVSKFDGDKVVFGATVVLLNTATEEQSAMQIVGEDEADIKQGKISIKAPIARALIGKQAGDEVIVNVPGGEREYVVVKIEYK
jgi:transcription elongation factor GreA